MGEVHEIAGYIIYCDAVKRVLLASMKSEQEKCMTTAKTLRRTERHDEEEKNQTLSLLEFIVLCSSLT